MCKQMCSNQAREATDACRFERLGSAEFIIQMQAKPRRPIRDASGYSSGEIENADVSGKRNERIERAARWLEGERERWRRGEVSQLCGDWSARALDRRRSAG